MSLRVTIEKFQVSSALSIIDSKNWVSGIETLKSSYAKFLESGKKENEYDEEEEEEKGEESMK